MASLPYPLNGQEFMALKGRSLWQSGYGKDAIPSYRLSFIYKNNSEHILISRNLLHLQ